MEQENYKLAIETFEHSLEIGEQVGTTVSLPHTMINLARSYWADGQSRKGRKLISHCLPIAQRMDIKIYIGQSLLCLAWIEFEDQQHKSARKYFCEAADTFLLLGDQTSIAECIEGLAALSASSSDFKLSAQLLSSSRKLREHLGSPMRTDSKKFIESSLEKVTRSLSIESLTQQEILGKSLTPELLLKQQFVRFGYPTTRIAR